ncbi:YfcE family phosphodiesterase [Arachidicoccus ginsenosidimutans]|uniref:metallophosphoesterase family protein n=1 Tax=Arachidicoccus sp. BS20 TaxID=1850526 RepID=UPI0007F111E9|nr:metallophosphoesterase family protein [Arachidicoccus sp. BS20]ANI89131.1 YfcE family phosphodiesterase [Arachidicoccus sp. BS20]
MKTIGLLSDTHGHLPENVFTHFKDCDEVWHAGDFGTEEVVQKLKAFKPLRGVYGNIDGQEIRSEFPLENIFYCEEVKVLMKHIGGYPKKYAPGVKDLIKKEKPQLFISGHSHILKIIYDKELECLHINPGACGLQGWHQVKTLVKFSIDGKEIRDCKIIELGKK